MRLLKLKNIFILLICFALFIGLLIFPQKVSKGVLGGLITSSNILIPSLFPFSVAAIFVSESGVLSFTGKNKFLYYFMIFVFSAIGGYPIGAKILAGEYKNLKIKRRDAEKALAFSINAGPSFVISFVGFSLFSSRKIGVILLAAHLFSSFTVFLILLAKLEKPQISVKAKSDISVAECFVNSVCEACKSIIIICGYAVFFAAITAICSSDFLPIKIFTGSLEITNSLMNVKNIYLAAFLLGFSGISIICQVLTVAKNFIKNIAFLVFGRLLHGLLSALFAFVLLKIFKTEIPVFKSARNFGLQFGITGTVISVLVILCGICLIISLQTKKYEGKFIKDIL